MDELTHGSDSAAVSGPPADPFEAGTLPVLVPEPPDRSMLVMQYGLAFAAAICAILLSHAS